MSKQCCSYLKHYMTSTFNSERQFFLCRILPCYTDKVSGIGHKYFCTKRRYESYASYESIEKIFSLLLKTFDRALKTECLVS